MIGRRWSGGQPRAHVKRRLSRSGFGDTFLDSSYPIFALAGTVLLSNTYTKDRM
jgi:hypothetical protein